MHSQTKDIEGKKRKEIKDKKASPYKLVQPAGAKLKSNL